MDTICVGCGRDIFGPSPGESPDGIGDGFVRLSDGFWHCTCEMEAERALERAVEILHLESLLK